MGIASLCTAVALVAAPPGSGAGAGAPSYDPLELHELIGLADLCVTGRIDRVRERTILVEVQDIGFGEPPGELVEVQRFKNWTCAHRWAEYEVGQRCLYFLRSDGTRPYQILSGGGEGEMPLFWNRTVRVRAERRAVEALGGENILGNVSLDGLLDECRRYRTVFRFCDRDGRLPWKYWIEPNVGEQDLEAYRRSSPLAAHLCERTLIGRYRSHYRDPAVRSPRPADAIPRLDLGLGETPGAQAVLPDLDGDGVDELLCAQRDALELVWMDKPARIRSLDRLTGGDWRTCVALASLGDLGGDGSQEIAMGDPGVYEGQFAAGAVRILSFDSEGALVRTRSLAHSDVAAGALLPRPERLGTGLAQLGDIDGDGRMELVVAAGGSSDPGWIRIVSLDAAALVVRSRAVLEKDESLRGGLVLASVGDVDGDGSPDLAAAAPNQEGQPLELFSLERDGAVRRRVRIAAPPTKALVGIGDWNGDGIPDLAVGSSGNEVRVLYLERDGRVLREQTLAPPGGNLSAEADFGRTLAALPQAGGPVRLLCAGYSWLEPMPGEHEYPVYLRRYPSLWAFDPPGR